MFEQTSLGGRWIFSAIPFLDAVAALALALAPDPVLTKVVGLFEPLSHT